MNSIIKDPDNIRTGKEWFDLLPKQLQERWLYYLSKEKEEKKDYIFNMKSTFKKFIYCSFTWVETEEGHYYWRDIAYGCFGVIQKKKSLLSKIINFFKS